MVARTDPAITSMRFSSAPMYFSAGGRSPLTCAKVGDGIRTAGLGLAGAGVRVGAGTGAAGSGA
jgi:hypothetical protein